MNYDVNLKGPMLDGRAERWSDDLVRDCEDRVADEAKQRVDETLVQVLRNPTGYYQSRIVKHRAQDHAVVDDSQVIYGPWLEGVGSKNETTSFKGYHTFRRVAQGLENRVVRLCQETVNRWIGRVS